MVDQLAGPLAYDPRWYALLGGIALLPLLVVACRAGLRAIRRPRTARVSSSERSRVLSEIDSLANANASGTLAARTTHSRLSAVVRDFVSATGGRIDGTTLRDLEMAGADEQLLAAIRLFYDGTFDSRPTASVDDAVTAARNVVTGWKG